MCGIAGIVGKVDADVAERLIVSLQSRGKDASGIAVANGRTVYVYKTNVEAASFVQLPLWKKARNRMKDSHVVLLHTRAATHGSPTNNDNNHPIYTDDSLIIHNGVVDVSKKYESYGQTDTEQFLRAIEAYGGGITGIEGAARITSGWLAIAYQCLDNPNTVLLYKDGSPIVAYENNGTIIFCSEKKIIADAIQQKEDDFKVHVLDAGFIYKLVYRKKGAMLLKTDHKVFTKTYNHGGYYAGCYGDDESWMYHPMYYRQTPSANSYQQRFIQNSRPPVTVDKLLEDNQKLQDWAKKYGDVVGWRWDNELKIQRRYNYTKKMYLDVQTTAEEMLDSKKKWEDKDDLKEIQQQLLSQDDEVQKLLDMNGGMLC